MENRPLVSIVIPVYKVEKFLDECVRSVINQTYENLEIILVDDGSPDDCPAMCDDYKAIDSRIIVIHKENGGLGSARNAGVDIASGKYIEFLDSDDWLLPETVEICVREAERNDLDILFFSARSFVDERDIGKINVLNSYKRTANFDEVMNGAACYARMRNSGEYYPQICMRFYKASHWKSYRFQDNIIHEDEDVGFLSLVHADRVEIIDRRFYQRRYHSGSIMTSRNNILSAEGYACAFESLAKAYQDCSDTEKKQFPRQMKNCLFSIIRLYNKTDNKAELRKKVQSHLQSGLKTDIKFSKKNRIALKSLRMWYLLKPVFPLFKLPRRVLSFVHRHALKNRSR